MSDVIVSNATHHHDEEQDWRFPLLLSCIAGASTSVGAAVVFCFSPATIQHSMSFSLSLAASVMITVSVISIGPECFEGVMEYETSNAKSSTSSTSISWKVVVDLALLSQRLFSFGMGCIGYYLLSRLLLYLPEPESFFAAAKEQMDELEEDIERRQQQQQQQERETLVMSPITHQYEIQRRCSGSTSAKSSVGAVRRNVNSGSMSHREALGLGHSSSQESIASGSDSSVPNRKDDGYDGKNRKPDIDANNSPSAATAAALSSKRRSWRVAMLLFVSLLCHNFPEGLAVVASTVESRELGVTVAIGILVHNIPEGIAIAVPCMAARPDAPWLAFWLASVSGLAEPIGALVALSVLETTQLPLENVLSCVAGIMCMVAVVELYPEAFRHVRHQNYRGMIGGTILGMLIMIATEWYFP